MTQPLVAPTLVIVTVGSESDIKKQCKWGIAVLDAAIEEGQIELYQDCFIVSSIHRMNGETRSLMEEIHNIERKPGQRIVLILGAGEANHLTGTGDAILRYDLQDGDVHVIGVAFEGKDVSSDAAAIGSIVKVPGTQVAYHKFFGARGFAEACRYAVSGNLDEIVVPERRFQKRIPRPEVREMAEEPKPRGEAVEVPGDWIN